MKMLIVIMMTMHKMIVVVAAFVFAFWHTCLVQHVVTFGREL